MKIQIKDKEIELKYNLRSIFIFETIAKKAYSLNTVLDMYLFFYSTILAIEPDLDLTFDELIDTCDSDPTIFYNFKSWFENELKKQSLLNNDDSGNNKKKRK